MAQDDNPSISAEVTKRQAWLQQAEDIRLPASTRIEAIENLAREYQAAWPEGEPPPTRSGEESIQQATKIHGIRHKEYQTIERLSLLLHRDDDRNVRRALVRLLPNWGEDGLRTLLPALQMPGLRSEAIKALDSMTPVTGSQREIKFLDALARCQTGEWSHWTPKPPFRRFRGFSDDALVGFGGRDPRVLEFLKERMQTGDQWQRALAASVLCGLGETEAAFGAVSDLQARVRKSLAVAIGYFNEQRGTEVLRRLLTDKDAAVSKAARISMARLENPEVEIPQSGAPHGNSEWAALLNELSDYRLTDDPELRVRLAGEGKMRLGETGATETQVTALEQRIGRSLPPSYRSFLTVSNGFQSPEHSIPKLYGTEAVDWFRVRHPQRAERDRVADSCLQISEAGRYVGRERPGYFAVILLRPQLKSPEGEWPTYFFADWNPGLGKPYRNFGEFMSRELPNCEWRV